MNANENPTGPVPGGDNNPKPMKRRERSGLNKAEVGELNAAESIVAVASRPERLAVLEPFNISAAMLAAVTDGIKTARNYGASATQNDTGKEVATIDVHEAENALVKSMRCVQAAAKRQFARTEPEKLDDFAVGKKIDASRPVLEEYSAQMLEKLNTERPPGIDTTFITKMAATRLQYLAADSIQGSKATAASSAREARTALVRTIKDRRLEIQFAADAAWPPGETGHAAIRRGFGLPPDRFFSVGKRKAA